VRACLATIFTEADGNDSEISYPAGDALAARIAGIKQLDYYERLRETRDIAFDPQASNTLHIGILMECADPIRDASDLEWWVQRGVIVIGLAWARGSRFAGGNTQTHGLTALGVDLVSEMDRLGIVHDLSHLSDRATDELLELSSARVIASHSNCRAITDPTKANQRHLRDEHIKAVIARDGVIGLNLFGTFLAPGITKQRRATIAQAVDHVERICSIAGHTRCVGLGSDMDGGLTREDLPEGIDSPSGLHLLLQELSRRGWTDAQLRAFAHSNWLRVFPRFAPAFS
jgi:membrane dipeptidase